MRKPQVRFTRAPGQSLDVGTLAEAGLTGAVRDEIAASFPTI
jgi:hypothetical protein